MGNAASEWFWKKLNEAAQPRSMTAEEIKQYRAKHVQDQMAETNMFDALWFKIKATVGICTPTVEQMNDYLKVARQHTKSVKTKMVFASLDPDLAKSLEKAEERISAVHQFVSKAATLTGDVSAACQISEAISVLNKWAADPNGDNKMAAAAFDKLFGGVARYADKLGPPIGAYAKVLEQISVTRFFGKMQRLQTSWTGENDATTKGQQMRRVLKEMDR